MNFNEDRIRAELAEAIGGLVPRDDQIEVAVRVIEWLSSESDKGKIVECATGWGKTMLAQMVIHWLVKNTNADIAFLVSRTELLAQTRIAMERSFGLGSVNITQGSKHEIKATARVRVAMQQTISSKIRNDTAKPVIRAIEEADIVFIDEVHQTFYSSFIDRVQEAGGRIVGLSATPDDHRLNAWFESVKILGLPQVELETSDPRILATPVILSYTGERKMDWAMAGITGEDERAKVRFGLISKTIVDEINQAERKVCEGEPLRWLVKTGRRSHAVELAEILTAGGIPAKAFISGKGGGSKKQIDAIFAGKSPYRAGVVVHRFSIGYDHPGIQGLVLTTETIYPAFVQNIGRVLRVGNPPSKDRAYILDMGGNWKVHRERYMERRESPEPMLPEPPEKRERMGSGEGEGSPVRDAEELGDMVVLTLPGISKAGFGRMDKAVLLAYCAVEAFGHFRDNPYIPLDTQRRMRDNPSYAKGLALKRALTNYWFITGQNVVAFGASDEKKREVANAIIAGNPEAMKVWGTLTPLPEPVMKRLMKARRKFSKQRRAA